MRGEALTLAVSELQIQNELEKNLICGSTKDNGRGLISHVNIHERNVMQ